MIERVSVPPFAGALLTVIVVAGLAAAGASPAAAQDPIPFIELAPNPVTGAPFVNVFGRHFCGEAACSPVTITIDEHVYAEGVPVDEDGRFVHEVRLDTPPGHYRVEATQTGSDGEELLAAETLSVAARDFAIDSAAQTSPSEDATPEPDGDGYPTAPTDTATTPASPPGDGGSPSDPEAPVLATEENGGGSLAPWLLAATVAAAALGAAGWYRRRGAP